MTGRAFIAALLAALLAGAALPQDAPRNDAAQARRAAMGEMRHAMLRLGDMAGGAAPYIRSEALAHRRTLIRVTGDIPRLFRHPEMDSHSRAEPFIWASGREFRARARVAEVAAKALKARSSRQLQATLPALLQACLNCHLRFRRD